MSDEPIKPDPERKPKRPADMNQRAKMIVDLATGAEEESQPSPAKFKAGRRGGETRAANLSDEAKSQIASKAAKARWKNS